MKFPDDPSVTLTIRLIMQGKVSRLRFFSHLVIDFFFIGVYITVKARTIESRDFLSFTRSNKSSCKSFIFTIFHQEEFHFVHFFFINFPLHRLGTYMQIAINRSARKFVELTYEGNFWAKKERWRLKPVKSFIAIV